MVKKATWRLKQEMADKKQIANPIETLKSKIKDTLSALLSRERKRRKKNSKTSYYMTTD